MDEIALSLGSIGGIGYELAHRVLNENASDNSFNFHIFCDKNEWEKTLQRFGNLNRSSISMHFETDSARAKTFCEQTKWKPTYSKSFEHLLTAIDYVAASPKSRALVTGPMRKNDFPDADQLGHTEVLRAYFKVEDATMLFWSEEVSMVTLTRHIPLKEVPRRLSSQQINLAFKHFAAQSSLFGKDFKDLHIAVTGLNPHAGEGGRIGQEEIEWMNKCLDGLRAQGWNITGPISADTALTPDNRKRFDIVLSCYHDQLLPAFKALYFSCSAQCTLGLPIIRVSVDHGTAEDLYMKGTADTGSFSSALQVAMNWLKASRSL